MGMSEASLPVVFTLAFGLAVFVPAGVTQARASDAIGIATVAATTCKNTGLANGNCYRVVISNCAEAAGSFAAGIKVNQPPDSSQLQGTVFFTTGGGGNQYYDFDSSFMGDSTCAGSNCGLMAVQSINSANYRTVQVNFSDPAGRIQEASGWLTGRAANGPRALACRYATLVHAVWTMLLASDTGHPVCATGNSGGGALIAYAITQYGMGNSSGPGPMFSMAEPTSGPPYGRIDHGCSGAAAPTLAVDCPAGVNLSENYGVQTAADYVDPAYGSKVCTKDINSNGAKAYANFQHDSNLSDDFATPSYKTVVRVLFGSADVGSPVPLGSEWYDAITSTKSSACIAGAPHELPQIYAGASAIVNDVLSLCK